jgi:uncharacterized membrane protein
MKTIAKLKRNSKEGVKSNKAAKIVSLFTAFAGMLILVFPQSEICKNIYNNVEIIGSSLLSLVLTLVYLFKK